MKLTLWHVYFVVMTRFLKLVIFYFEPSQGISSLIPHDLNFLKSIFSIEAQMSQSRGNKVQQAYDDADFLPECIELS